jgi:hypothetical protein
LIAFVLLLMLVSRAVGAETLGPVADAAWRTTLLQVAGLAGVAVLYGLVRGWEFAPGEKIGYDLIHRMFRTMIGRHLGTVLLATNDPAEIALADQVWTLEGGRVRQTRSGEQYRDEMWLAGQSGQKGTTWARLASH